MKLLFAAFLGLAIQAGALQSTDEVAAADSTSDTQGTEATEEGVVIEGLVTDPSAQPDDPAFFGRTYIGYYDVKAKWSGGVDLWFDKGHYEAYCKGGDEWYYSSGRNWNAEGDPNKDDRDGLVFPGANFDQLIIRARKSSGASREWIPYFFNYQDFYSSGEYCRFQCDDRPNDYGDNGGSIRVFFYKA